MLAGRLPTSIWELQVLGWTVDLSLGDIDWLLEDAPNRTEENERQLAINTAMMIWRDAGRTDELRARIAAVVGQDAAMSTAFNSWLSPPPKSKSLIESENRLAEMQRRNALEKAAHDKSSIISPRSSAMTRRKWQIFVPAQKRARIRRFIICGNCSVTPLGTVVMPWIASPRWSQ